MGKKAIHLDLLAWIAYVYFIIYFFLLVTDRLNSQLIADVFGIASMAYLLVAYLLGTKFQKLDQATEDLKELKTKLEEHIKKFNIHTHNKNTHE